MLELKKSYNVNCCEKFTIKTEEGSFKIFYDEDLSLYWSPSIPEGSDIKDVYKFTITNENRKVYNIFNELYDSVTSKRPFKYFQYDNAENYVSYDDNQLVKNDVIEWHSDDFVYDAASCLRIEKDNDNNEFIITFNKSKLVYDDISPFSTFAVKISTGESRYDPYNATFIKMYRNLCNYCDNRGYTFSNKPWYKKRRVRKR